VHYHDSAFDCFKEKSAAIARPHGIFGTVSRNLPSSSGSWRAGYKGTYVDHIAAGLVGCISNPAPVGGEGHPSLRGGGLQKQFRLLRLRALGIGEVERHRPDIIGGSRPNLVIGQAAAVGRERSGALEIRALLQLDWTPSAVGADPPQGKSAAVGARED